MGTSQINARGAQQAAIVGESHVTPKPAEQKKDAGMSNLSYDFGDMPLHSSAKGGTSMDKTTQSAMSQHFGADFGGVKIHTDDNAVNMNRQFNARAFTVNNNIYFNQGEYKPGTKEGQHSLAHELVHTIQQGRASHSAIQAKSIIDRPDSLHEKEADSIANSFTQAQDSGYRSSALQMRSNMGITPLTNSVIQRMPKTSGGEWFAENYNDAIDKDQDGKATPAAWGMRGVDIDLKFRPNEKVDAELIGLTQSVQSYVDNKLAPTPAAATRGIPSKDAKSIDTGKGETDEGTAIDRASGYNNPIYPVQSQPSKSLDDPNTSAGWGQNGWNDKTKKPAVQDAILKDTPRRGHAEKNSRQIFEVTALATKGAQAGTYYGSVRWGWRTDDKGNFTKINPITVVSEGVPSSTFLKAAQIWNKGKDSSGNDNVNLPIVDVKVTTAWISEVVPASTKALPMTSFARTISPGTRVQIVSWGSSSATGENPPRIRILSGVFIGSTIAIPEADLSKLTAERT